MPVRLWRNVEKVSGSPPKADSSFGEDSPSTHHPSLKLRMAGQLSKFMLITIAAILIFIVLATFAYGSKRGAPWIPTRKDDVERFLKLIKIEPGQTVIDLGSGDGRLLFACAKKGAIAKGYEVAILPYLVSKWRQTFSKETPCA